MTPEETQTIIESAENRTDTRVGTRTSSMGHDEHVSLPLSNRLTHVFNAGPTGTGKSELITNVAAQDIHAGRGVAVISPAGDTIDNLLDRIPDNRLEDIIYLNPNQEPITRINVLQPYLVEDMTQAQLENQKEMIVSDVIDLFRRHNVGDWGPRFGQHLETLLRAHLDLNIKYDEQANLVDVYRCVVDDDALKSLIDRTDNEFIRNQLVRIYEDMGTYELEPLQRRLNTLVQNDTVNRVVDAGTSSIDFREIIDEGKILLVDVKREHIGKDAARIIGSVVVTSIWAAAQSRITQPEEERDPFMLACDEVHNFGGEGSNFTTLLAESRKYGLGCWLASQYLNQLEPEMRRAVKNNCRTKIFFDPTGTEDLTEVAAMLNGFGKDQLTTLGNYRAVMQQPGDGRHRDAVTFTTYPPWGRGREEEDLDEIKLDSTIGELSTAEKARVQRTSKILGPMKDAGDYHHRRLLEQAQVFLEKRPEVEQVNLLYQERDGRPDGEVIKTSGDVANLEAEVSTLDNPGKVLQNYGRAIQEGRKCIFVVESGFEDRLENIITDPVNRRGSEHEDETGSFSYYKDGDGNPIENTDVYSLGEYRILVVDGETVHDHAKQGNSECPELDPPEFTEDDLQESCAFREDGYCALLDEPCVLLEQ